MSNGIKLTKGTGISLTKRAPGLKRVRVGLGWDTAAAGSRFQFDLDASAFICRDIASPKLLSNDHFVFYNQVSDPEKSVLHSGDSRDGLGDGDDESITVDLARVSPAATEISFIVTIHEAAERGQNFGQVRNSYIAIYNDETGEELARYSLEEGFTSQIAVQFGSLYHEGNEWTFKAVGNGFNADLGDVILKYGGTLG